MFEEIDPEGQNNNNPDEAGEMNDMAALLEQAANPISIKRGDVVEGVIVRIDQDEILVDIGLKSEGVLSTKELPATGYGSFHELHMDDKDSWSTSFKLKHRMVTPCFHSGVPTLSDSGVSLKSNIGMASCLKRKSLTITKAA